MAGIGFVLRKLVTKDDYMGVVRAYFHATVAAVGPWIFVVSSLAMISLFTSGAVQPEKYGVFSSTIVYNLLFSFLLAAPLYMITGRALGDCIYECNPVPIPGLMLVTEIYLLVPIFIVATLFYGVIGIVGKQGGLYALLSIANFVLFAATWFQMLYLSCVQNYRPITICWLCGTIFAVALSVSLGQIFRVNGLLLGLNIGMAVLLFSLKAYVFAQYPHRFVYPKNYKNYFRHKAQFFSGFLLYASMWVDNMIMWATPAATQYPNLLRIFPLYDSSMFLSYLSVLPMMALFVFSLETNFYDAYIAYIKSIETNAPFSMIEKGRKGIIKKITENGRIFLVLQGSFSLFLLAIAPTLFERWNINFLGLHIFEFGVVGAFFNVLNIFLVILFAYFDNGRYMLYTTLTMFCTNAILTLAFLPCGFSCYGLSYPLSMLCGFILGSFLLIRLLRNLHFHIFVTNIVQKQRMRGTEAPVQLRYLRKAEKIVK